MSPPDRIHATVTTSADALPVPRWRSLAARVLLGIIQLAIAVGFAWELEPLVLYRPVRAVVTSASYETRLIPSRSSRRSAGTRSWRYARFPLISYRYVVNGRSYVGAQISRHPFDEWKGAVRRSLGSVTTGSVRTAYYAPYDPVQALLIRRPNAALLFILTIGAFFTGIVSLFHRPRRRQTVRRAA